MNSAKHRIAIASKTVTGQMQGWVVTKYLYFVTVLRYFSEYFSLVTSYNFMLYFYFYFRYFFKLLFTL